MIVDYLDLAVGCCFPKTEKGGFGAAFLLTCVGRWYKTGRLLLSLAVGGIRPPYNGVLRSGSEDIHRHVRIASSSLA